MNKNKKIFLITFEGFGIGVLGSLFIWWKSWLVGYFECLLYHTQCKRYEVNILQKKGVGPTTRRKMTKEERRKKNYFKINYTGFFCCYKRDLNLFIPANCEKTD